MPYLSKNEVVAMLKANSRARDTATHSRMRVILDSFSVEVFTRRTPRIQPLVF
jgi:hypothetical protein